MTKMRFMATFRVPWPALHAEMVPFLAGNALEVAGSLAHFNFAVLFIRLRSHRMFFDDCCLPRSGHV